MGKIKTNPYENHQIAGYFYELSLHTKTMTDVETDDPEFPERAPLLKEANPDPEQPSTSSQSYEKKLKENNDQVGEVLGIMWNNLKGIVKRGEKLEDVEKNAGILEEGAEKFKVNAKKLERKEYWKNVKYSIILAILLIVFIILIGFAIYEMLKE